MRWSCLVLMVVVLVGCGETGEVVQAEAEPVGEVYTEPAWRWLPGEDRALSAEERVVLAAVQRLAEERREANWRPVDYLYEIERRDDGAYTVFLRHLIAYEDGAGMQTPGGHSLYVMDAEGGLIRFMPGR
ncbi:hypothetical protein [Mucisphaera calidilacus]|uniref:Lipoprotein n=1 Tax=Mucisphaera calidilacus TaxID=2527982 RepID=A0A518BY59_9BACT|nr:hypothetical protein [Mucisphaera calidilacus]QDU71917.1 hypothetical protein Pan265_17760 [Mucisphaera calidilacus]